MFFCVWVLGMLVHVSASLCYEKDSHMDKKGLAGMCTAPSERSDDDNNGDSGDTAGKRQIHCLPKALAKDHFIFLERWIQCGEENKEDIKAVKECLDETKNSVTTVLSESGRWYNDLEGPSKECVYKDNQVTKPKTSQKDWMAGYNKYKLEHPEHPEFSKLLKAATEAFAIDDDYKNFMNRIKNPECEEVCGEKAIPLRTEKPDSEEIKNVLEKSDFFCLKKDGALDKNVKLQVEEGKCKAFNLGLYLYNTVFDKECWKTCPSEPPQYAYWPKQVVCTEDKTSTKVLSKLDQEECSPMHRVEFSMAQDMFTSKSQSFLNEKNDCDCDEGEFKLDFQGEYS